MMNKILRFKLLVFCGLFFAGHSAFAQLQEPQTPAQDLQTAIEDVASNVGKAVVSISTERIQRIPFQGYYHGMPYSSPFEDEFFRDFFEKFFGAPYQREFKQQGLGSGVIIDAEGYILTNEHVVAQADKITVTLPDGRVFDALIKGTDSRSDLAVIKIAGKNLPAAKLGDSSNLKIGQWAVAIGNPFGFAIQNPEPTVTVGVVSALHRSLGIMPQAERDYRDLIQTDAAINPGNSGGPLVNLKGEIIGINVAIFSTSGGYQGIGFAIPINSAKRVLSRLIEGKKIVYGWLGVTVQDIDDKLKEYFGLSEKKGALVVNILRNGPADKAGIKQGDIITKYDNQAILNVRELLNAVGKTDVGRKVAVELIREKKPLILSVQLEVRQDLTAKAADGTAQDETQQAAAQLNWRGMQVSQIDAELIKNYNFPFSQENRKAWVDGQAGLIIIEIRPGSPADEVGLMTGDIILEVNRRQIDSLAVFQNVTKSLKGDALIRSARGYFVLKDAK